VIDYPAPLKAVGGARTGIAPVNILDVLDVNGNLYFWTDRPLNAPVVITGSMQGSGGGSARQDPPVPVPSGQYIAWTFPTTVNAISNPPFSSASGGLESGEINVVLSHVFATGSSLTYVGSLCRCYPPML